MWVTILVEWQMKNTSTMALSSADMVVSRRCREEIELWSSRCLVWERSVVSDSVLVHMSSYLLMPA